MTSGDSGETVPNAPAIGALTVRDATAHQPGSEHHRNLRGGAVRAAVFGVSDGLLTNVSLILGVAGAHPAAGVVRLAGLAGLFAGAFSMAAGEYVSMAAQSELLQYELDVERRAHTASPDSERRELSAIYRDRGLTADEADKLSTRIMANPEVALEVHAREELGIDPSDTGSPRGAAVASFVSFAVGAVAPLIPWFVTSGVGAVIASIIIGVILSVAIGWTLGSFTGRSRLRSALRQLLIGAVAAALTYGIGAAVGGVTGTAGVG